MSYLFIFFLYLVVIGDIPSANKKELLKHLLKKIDMSADGFDLVSLFILWERKKDKGSCMEKFVKSLFNKEKMIDNVFSLNVGASSWY